MVVTEVDVGDLPGGARIHGERVRLGDRDVVWLVVDPRKFLDYWEMVEVAARVSADLAAT